MAYRFTLPVLVLAALAALLAMTYAGRSAASASEAQPQPAAAPLLAPPPPLTTAAEAAKPKPKPRWRSLASSHRLGHAVAIVRRAVPLRSRPNGRAVARAARWTEFGDQRVMSIAQQRGPWLGVVATERPNGKLAWVHMKNRGLDFRRSPYSLHADLSGRWLELRRSRTPCTALQRRDRPARLGDSDRPLRRHGQAERRAVAPYYGCCILALNGHQPKLPAGWQGGNRLAIHGTNAPGTIGSAASAGCLRAADSELQVLMRRVPLGTPVFIRG